MIFAIITGLLYGRFAKPSAKFMFSKNMLFSPFNEGNSLQFRIINQRKSMVMDMRVRMLVSYSGKNGARTYKALELERDNVVLFPLNWTIVHPINELSPIHGKTMEELQQLDAEFIIVLKGYDDTFSQEIHSIHSYTYQDIVWNAKFDLMYESSEDGSTRLHINKLNDYTRL
jgi:inward rectifier potassium channel